ncbi:MAG: KEOPS complex kinase/ATPase Bud32 [Candidatus Micrarchaeota archaeon]|nr:KEOPS complex kinase/ATPase Bud32 [Candidatus Micrarchaeota archaeon]
MAEFLARGAEAELYLDTLLGKSIVRKKRVPKKYRIREIDVPLRKSRTRSEASLLHSAKEAGVACPSIYEIGDFEIKLSFIDGVLLRDFIRKHKTRGLSRMVRAVGEALASLHSADVVHGDFTTANIMVSKGKVFFIDFGLGGFSKDPEEKAIDVLLMKKSLGNESAYRSLLSGYEKYNRYPEVMEQLAEIEKRGRYVVRNWTGA